MDRHGCEEQAEAVPSDERSLQVSLIRHVALRTRDMERSRFFYEEILGLKFLRYLGDGCYLTDGTVNLTFIQYDGEPPRPPLAYAGEYIHLGLFVEDLAEIFQRLNAEGFTILREDIKNEMEFDYSHVPEGSFKVADPDGNVIDITEREDEWDGVRL